MQMLFCFSPVKELNMCRKMLQLFTSYALEPLLESDYHDSKGLDVG